MFESTIGKSREALGKLTEGFSYFFVMIDVLSVVLPQMTCASYSSERITSSPIHFTRIKNIALLIVSHHGVGLCY